MSRPFDVYSFPFKEVISRLQLNRSFLTSLFQQQLRLVGYSQIGLEPSDSLMA
jgi:hypothetical protein